MAHCFLANGAGLAEALPANNGLSINGEKPNYIWTDLIRPPQAGTVLQYKPVPIPLYNLLIGTYLSIFREILSIF